METTTLIRTKLNRPRVVSDLVERPRLVGVMNKGLERELTLVSAPAGYGKSTLVTQWLETCERSSAWLSLDRSDSDLVVYLNYFIAAVQTLFPDVGKEVLALLQSPNLPSLQALTATLINDLDPIEQPFILALDDYHLIHDMAVHNLMDELLRYAPRTLHLVLISRLNPPLNLHQLRARGQMVEIRAEDLRFTADETRTFAQKVWQAPLDRDDAIRLKEKTEGWATGLRLCVLSMKGPDGFDALADRLPGRGLATEYLFHEVFVSQPKVIQECLLKTSILDRFSASLSEHLRDDGTESESISGQAFIDWLQQADIFVIALDIERQWFRYHHLFQDLLKRQLGQVYDAESIARLHDRASEWFAQNGLIEEAIQHALAADDLTRAAELIEQHKDEILNADQWPILERWLSYLPEKIIQQRVGLIVARLWIAHIHYDIRTIGALLGKLDVLLEGGALDPATAGERALFRGTYAFWREEIEQSIERLERALTLIPSENKFAYGAVDIYLAIAYQMTGQFEKSVTTYQALLDDEREGNSRKGKLMGSLIFVYLLSGDAARAYEFVRRLKSVAERMDDPFFVGWAAYLSGNIHFGWNDLEAAVRDFMQTVDNRFFLNPNTAVDGYIGLALSYQALGQKEQADAVMDQLSDYVSALPSFSALMAHSARARLALWQGDRARVAHLLRTIDFSPDSGTLSFLIEYPRITHARLLIARGTEASLEESIGLLQKHLQFARDIHNIRQQIVILPLLAVAYLKRGWRQQAIRSLKEAVTLTEPGGWIRPFLEFELEMAELFSTIKWGNDVRDFIDQVRAALPSPSSGSLARNRSQLPEPLTDREIEVLTLLARRYQAKEIAAELFISPATVRRHVSNIYQKLGVNRRQEAVEKAVVLGIIPSLG